MKPLNPWRIIDPDTLGRAGGRALRHLSRAAVEVASGVAAFVDEVLRAAHDEGEEPSGPERIEIE